MCQVTLHTWKGWLMNYKEIEQLKISLPKAETYIANYTSAFDVKFAHHSTAIEGNTLSFIETKLVIEDRQSIGGKSLREIYEVANHHDAFMYICDQVQQGFSLNEEKVKKIHRLLLDKIATYAGTYRANDVFISGTDYVPPSYDGEMYPMLRKFYEDLSVKTMIYNPIEYAAWTHAEFVHIHPFNDGNGRTARLLLNYQLMFNGYLPIIIPFEERNQYYQALQEYDHDHNLEPFAELIGKYVYEELKKTAKYIRR